MAFSSSIFSGYIGRRECSPLLLPTTILLDITTSSPHSKERGACSVDVVAEMAHRTRSIPSLSHSKKLSFFHSLSRSFLFSAQRLDIQRYISKHRYLFSSFSLSLSSSHLHTCACIVQCFHNDHNHTQWFIKHIKFYNSTHRELIPVLVHGTALKRVLLGRAFVAFRRTLHSALV